MVHLPAITINQQNNNIYVTFIEEINELPMVRFIKSTDNGSSWSTPKTVHEIIFGHQRNPTISVDNTGRITILYYHNKDVFISESFDEGGNFLPPIQINNPSAQYTVPRDHYIGVVNLPGGNSYCVWVNGDEFPGKIYFSPANSLLHYASENNSLDNSATSLSTQRKLVKDEAGNYHLVFTSWGQIFYNKSTDNGNTWIAASKLSSPIGINGFPSIATHNNHVFVTWQQYNGIINEQHKYTIKGIYKHMNSSQWKEMIMYDSDVFFSELTNPLPVIAAADNVDDRYNSDDGLPEVMIVFGKPDGIYYINLFYIGIPNTPVQDNYEQKGSIQNIPFEYSGGEDYGYSNPSIAANDIGEIMVTCHSALGSVYAAISEGDGWTVIDPGVFSVNNIIGYENCSVTSDGMHNFHITWTGYNQSYNTNSILHKMIGTKETAISEFTNDRYASYQPSSFGHIDENGGVSIYWNTENEIKRVINDGDSWDFSTYSNIPSIHTDANFVNALIRDDPESPAYVYTYTEGPLHNISVNISTGLFKGGAGFLNGGFSGGIQTHRTVEFRQKELDVLLSLRIGNLRLVDINGNETQINPEKFYENLTFTNLSSALSTLLSDSIPNNSQLNKVIFDYSYAVKNIHKIKAGMNNPKIKFVLRNRVTGNYYYTSDSLYLPADSSLQVFSGTHEINLNNINLNNSLNILLILNGLKQNYLHQAANVNLINTYLFASDNFNKGNSSGKRGLSQLNFSLHQNYPNPFNPITIISWHSPVGSLQTLRVYDVLGREVATLVDEYKEAGSYSVEFNSTRLPSGVYFYKLSSGNFTQTKKMVLLR